MFLITGTMTNAQHTFLLALQLTDSAFPIGSFSHSNGYEAARQLGYVYDSGSFRQFCLHALENAAALQLPFIRTTHERLTREIAYWQTSLRLRKARRTAAHKGSVVSSTSSAASTSNCTSLDSGPTNRGIGPLISGLSPLRLTVGQQRAALYGQFGGKGARSCLSRVEELNINSRLFLVVQESDEQIDACLRPNQHAHRASVTQGRALLSTCLAVLPPLDYQEEEGERRLGVEKKTERNEEGEEEEEGCESLRMKVLKQCEAALDERELFGHFPVLFATVCALTGIGVEECLQMHLFGVLRNVVSAAVREGQVGSLEGQKLLTEYIAAISPLIVRYGGGGSVGRKKMETPEAPPVCANCGSQGWASSSGDGVEDGSDGPDGFTSSRRGGSLPNLQTSLANSPSEVADAVYIPNPMLDVLQASHSRLFARLFHS